MSVYSLHIFTERAFHIYLKEFYQVKFLPALQASATQFSHGYFVALRQPDSTPPQPFASL